MGEPCPVCTTELTRSEDRGERSFYECKRCGLFSLSYEARQDLAWHMGRNEEAPRKLSYALYRMTKQEQWAMLTTDLIANILANAELPRPQEQLENLILWMGVTQPSMGSGIQVDERALSATGAEDMGSLGFLISQASNAGLMTGEVIHAMGGDCFIPSAQLTLSGWGMFENLQRGKASGRIAFMAMQFGDEELDRIYKDHFKPAIAATGFDLKRVDEGQPAGLIDDRLRVEIRQSRFLIADLTHQNRGAYWEAGYAEGLGKPVIYTCRKDVFEDKTKGTHFDTNHHLTVVWAADMLAEAVEKLKATVRATLPEEAKLED
ncbi:MAG TPA: hypothetical protein PKE50_13665 [Rhodocyclaceae bacterium]|nr:hypothetical protein [Rhodocyclaceae bacterium]HNA86292.1 hypothetical protein [Nitrospira sp.]HNG03833.1 hypothetical protein [Nitrospira sp.]HNM22601.1 hypothetical protein [Rhodocyclaceae bacterium]